MKPEEREELHKELKEKFEYTQDLNNLEPIKHTWVDRGEVMSCEGAAHANHRVFKRR